MAVRSREEILARWRQRRRRILMLRRRRLSFLCSMAVRSREEILARWRQRRRRLRMQRRRRLREGTTTKYRLRQLKAFGQRRTPGGQFAPAPNPWEDYKQFF